jgi:hypothetical protein
MKFPNQSIVLIFPVLLLSLLPTRAHAILPGGDAYFGYSYIGSNNFYPNVGGLNGWELAGHLKLMPFFGLEADVAHDGFGAAAAVPRTTLVLVGPRLTVGPKAVQVFVRGLVGGEHSANSSTATPTSGGALAIDFGGGVDVRIAPFFAWRVAEDFVDAPTQSGSGSHSRFGTGLVFRF